MGFDSTANLLFSISADSSEAENNIQRFRTLFGTSMDDMRTQVGDWADKIFGDTAEVGDAFTALGPIMAAGFVVAIAAAAKLGAELVELAQKAADYDERIETGMRITGMSAEQMSGLGYAANYTKLQQEELNGALTKFATAILAAESPTSKQAAAFRAMGISQADVKAGETNLYPLLLKVADAFSTHADNVNKAAIARDLFGRGGTALIETLDLGAEGFRKLGLDAERTGHIVGDQGVDAGKNFRTELMAVRMEFDGMALQIGQRVLPMLTMFLIELDALAITANKVSKDVRWWEAFIPGASSTHAAVDFLTSFSAGADQAIARYKDLVATLKQPPPNLPSLPAPIPAKEPKLKFNEPLEDYRGLSEMLDQLKVSLAGATSEEARITAETEKLDDQLLKATRSLTVMANEGKISAEDYAREWQALQQAIPLINQVAAQKLTALTEKRNQAELSARADLTQRLEAQQEDTYQHQVRLWNDEIDKLTARMAKEKTLSQANEALLDQIRAAGLAKREKAASDSFAKELTTLTRELQQMLGAYLTSDQRIEQTYRQDMLAYSRAEEEKTKATVVGEAQRNVIHVQFEQLRRAALRRMQTDLTTLRNSQGWQGVFGNVFAQGIRNNQSLMNQWATSAHRDLLMVKVSLEDMKQMAVEAFDQLATAEAQGIVHACIYKKSIGEAMRQAATDTLEALASMAVKKAIFAAAEGFLDLACGDFAGAAAAFEAAALYGAVGVGAAVAARAIAPKQATAGAGAGAGSTADTSSSATSSGSGSSSGSSGPAVNVYVYGHVYGTSGVDELAGLLSDAVKGRDVKLIATQTKSGTRAVR